MKLPCVLGGLLLVAGCADTALIRTYPPGAKVTINNQYIGVTPVEYVAPRGAWPADNTFHYRFEREGYVTQEGTFRGEEAHVRGIGAFFTLGLTKIFRNPNGFKGSQYEFELKSLDVVHGTEPGPREDRLRRLQDLYDRGLITAQEYKRFRSDIIHDLLKEGQPVP
jgi:NADPH-dependent glutamate synthase beta subunit-like oxidoreductase